jgi:LysR family glycine cleavage system transcriptional activator/LysR family transcriptional regulator of beta-lactamase
MVRRLPSLNGLRAFEAAGRHGSFTAAANELNVTQTAVSRMVRLLEQRIGFALFRRQANALELTARGQTLLGGLTDSFDSIARLAEHVAAMRGGPVLTVGVGPTLAMNWLIPRLGGFYQSHPEVEVRMATGGATRPIRDDWTCTIRRDVGASSGHTAEELFPSTLVAVCTPALAAGLREPSDLRKATLIFVPHLSDDWPRWFEAAGLPMSSRPAAEVFFDNNAMAMQAVLAGVGVAAAQPLYITDALASGRLVVPFPFVARKREAWYLEYRPNRADDTALVAFRDWLHGEAKLQRQIEADLVKQRVDLPTRKSKTAIL